MSQDYTGGERCQSVRFVDGGDRSAPTPRRPSKPDQFSGGRSGYRARFGRTRRARRQHAPGPTVGSRRLGPPVRPPASPRPLLVPGPGVGAVAAREDRHGPDARGRLRPRPGRLRGGRRPGDGRRARSGWPAPPGSGTRRCPPPRRRPPSRGGGGSGSPSPARSPSASVPSSREKNRRCRFGVSRSQAEAAASSRNRVTSVWQRRSSPSSWAVEKSTPGPHWSVAPAARAASKAGCAAAALRSGWTGTISPSAIG